MTLDSALLGLIVLLLGWVKLDVFHIVKRLDAHVENHEQTNGRAEPLRGLSRSAY